MATSDAALAARVDAARAALAEAREARDRRAAYAAELERVPDRMVARLPNPTVVEGRESWILVRHGRVYLADREQLYDEASRAIQRILADGGSRYVRQDEFESVAHYLRKRDVGVGNFRWRFETEPENRVVLAWRSRDEGIERTRLASDPRLRAWLAERSPELDFILFQVWSDSFETYLEARKLVEQAGFRAGWRGRSEDEEIRLPLSFGPKPPPLRRIEVD